ncbi:hypothetical protein FRB93_002159 [Tulasnella sp. JGI-2019a]|nr:hypothetical protein FRB93_002159 [Tulasnella sp. JGI-2019a]
MTAPQHIVTLFLALTAAAVRAQSGSGFTTRYWDCCKTSCAWSGKAAVTTPVESCDVNNNPLAGANAVSGCDGGTAFACADNQPWAVSDTLAYGYAAVNLAGETEADWCCSCYQLTFTSGAVSGKTMIVQATNTGGDVSGDQFDLMIPGGGVGIFTQGCTAQYGSISAWGAQYGGVTSAAQCSGLPAALQAGCNFRFGWMGGSDNPTVNWQKVTCPAPLAANSGCVRTAEGTVPGSTTVASGATTTSTTSTTSTTTTKATTSTTSTAKMVTTTTAAAVTTTTPTTRATTTTTVKTTTPSATTTVQTATPATTTAAAASACSSSTSLEEAAHWGQCGGIGWTGPTTCASPYTCVAQAGNPYYSQCL